MKIKDGFVVEKVGGKYLAVAVGKRADEFSALIRMNSTGAFLWEQLSGEDLSRDELVRRMLAEYDVEAERAEADTDAFLAKLAEAGLLDD